MSIDMKLEISEQKEELIAIRRDLHMYPEIAFEEHRTAGIIADRLKSLGYQVQTGIAGTGVVGVLDCGKPGKTIMLRADMDALPVQEIEGRSYGSTIPNRMHGCGHDAHTAVSLVVADLLAKHRAQLRGKVKVVFQPAEEIIAGGKLMLEAGVLKDPVPDRILGFHTWATMEVGKVGVHTGAMWAGVDEVRFLVKGVGGHGGTPHIAIDPVVTSAHVLIALQNILARELAPMQPAALAMGVLQSGSLYNVIPSEAEIRGSCRTFSPQTRQFVHRRAREIAEGIAGAFRCSAEFEVVRGAPAVVNDAETCESVREAAAQAVGPDNVVDPGQSTVGDDVSYFLQEVPGCYYLVGIANPEKGAGAPHHSPEFDIDEDSLSIAAETMARAAVSFLS